MRRTRRHLRPTLAVVRRDVLIAWSYRLHFAAGILNGFVSLAMFYFISGLVRVDPFATSAEYFAFAAVGIMIFTVINATIQIPQLSLRQELVAGTFEKLLLAPWGSVAAFVSLLVYPALYALFTVVGLVCIGATVFDLQLQWSTVPLAGPVALLSLFAFAPFGVLLLASVILIKRAPPGSSYLVAGLSLVAGLYFPVALLPGWLEWLSEVQPLSPAVDLLRTTLVGQSMTGSAWAAVGKLVAFAALALPVSIFALRAALRTSRRRGTILEY